MGSRQWQDVVDGCRQLEVLGLLGKARLDCSSGRIVGTWIGKVRRAVLGHVEFEEFDSFCKAVVMGVDEEGSGCNK